MMRSKLLGLVSMFIMTLVGCLSGAWSAEAPDSLVKPANLGEKEQGDTVPVALVKGRISNQLGRYLLGPGDKISIKIQDLDTYNQEFEIRPDGYATIHPFGEYQISGMEVTGLKEWLDEKFRYYLVNPQITVDLEKMRPALIYVTGAVNRPGTYQFIREGLSNTTYTNQVQEKVEITLSNVIAKAGGVTEYADIQNILVKHASRGEQETYNLRSLLADGNGQDIWLLPGDTVMVPEAQVPMDPETFKLVSRSTYFRGKFPVVVLGAVQHQGEVSVDPHNNSLNAAIALAGGFVSDLNRRAEQNQIVIQRPTQKGAYSRWIVDRRKGQFELQPGDVVYVANSKITNVEQVFRFISSMAVPYFYSMTGTSALKNVLPSAFPARD